LVDFRNVNIKKTKYNSSLRKKARHEIKKLCLFLGMQDKITIDRISLLHPIIREEGLQIYNEICEALKGSAICRFAYTLRTFAEQDALYAKGRTEAGKIVTNAKGGMSYHNYGLAIDIVLLKDKDGNGTFETASWETNVDFDGDGVSEYLFNLKPVRIVAVTYCKHLTCLVE